MSYQLDSSNKRLSAQSTYILGAILFFILLTLFFLPLLGRYPHSVVPSWYPDVLEFLWTTWRLERVVAGGEPLYSTKLVYAPEGASLLLHTLCEGVLLPITSLHTFLSPEWRLNAAFIVSCIVNFFCSLSLFSALTSARGVVVLNSLLVTFSPFLVGHLHAGHLNFVAMFPLLEVMRGLLIGFRYSEREGFSRFDSIRFTLATSSLPFINLYYLYFVAMIGGMFTLYDLIAHRQWRNSLRVGAAGLMALIVVLPHLAAIAQLASSGEYSPDHSPRKHAADISYFFIPSTIQRIGEVIGDDSQKRLLHLGESSLYLPISMVLIALSCAYRWRASGNGGSRSIALFIVAAIFYLLSLGPLITLFGDKIAVNWIFIGFDKVLPLFPSVPARFAGIGYVLFLLGITIAARDIKGSLRGKGIIFGLVIALCETYPAQVPVRELAVSQSLLSKLREVPPGPVLDLSRIPQDAMMRQIAHHRPLVGGFLSRRPKKEVASLRRNFFYRYVREGVDSADREIVAGWQALGAPVVVVPKTDVSKEVLNRLSQLQFREVLADGDLILITHDSR